MEYSLRLSPKRIAFILGFIAVLFAVETMAGAVVRLASGDSLPGPVNSLIAILNSGGERSVPTWFAVALLLVCGLVLALIAAFKWKYREPYRYHWLALSLLFVAMSAEEIIGLHERLNAPLRRWLGATSLLHYAWVIVGAVLVVLFAIAFFRFWWRLDKRTRWLFALAAVLYLVGSIGFEMLGAQILTARGGESLRFWAFAVLEELFEMLGVIVFLNTLLEYVSRYFSEVRIEVGEGPPTAVLAEARRDTRAGLGGRTSNII